MKLNNEKGIILGVFIIFGIGCAMLKVAEVIDHEVINKERYKTMNTNFRGDDNIWEEKLKIETNVSHDANTLPPGVRVDTEYKAGE